MSTRDGILLGCCVLLPTWCILLVFALFSDPAAVAAVWLGIGATICVGEYVSRSLNRLR